MEKLANIKCTKCGLEITEEPIDVISEEGKKYARELLDEHLGIECSVSLQEKYPEVFKEYYIVFPDGNKKKISFKIWFYNNEPEYPYLEIKWGKGGTKSNNASEIYHMWLFIKPQIEGLINRLICLYKDLESIIDIETEVLFAMAYELKMKLNIIIDIEKLYNYRNWSKERFREFLENKRIRRKNNKSVCEIIEEC